MAKIERIREVLVRSLDAEHLKQRTDAGWKLIALEWQREIEGEEAAPEPLAEEVPFGLKVAADCSHLEENVTEKQALVLMMGSNNLPGNEGLLKLAKALRDS